MATAQRINLYFDRFNARFDQLVPNIVAETAVEFYGQRFIEQNWEGAPWQPLSAKYAAKKTKGRGRILTRTAALQRSIRPSTVSANRVTVSAGGRNIPYARVHNEGQQITGVRKVRTYTNTNFMGSGRRVQIPAHTRTVNYRMPQRRFMGPSRTLNKLIRARLIAAFNASN
jgi:phage gpG-like protein